MSEIKTVGDAWKRIDELARLAGKSAPKTETEILSLGAEAEWLYREIDAAVSRAQLAGLKANPVQYPQPWRKRNGSNGKGVNKSCRPLGKLKLGPV